MNKGSPFLNILPSIDLHGYPREMIYVLVDDFINENIKLGKNKILVIHGKGTGVLRKAISNMLKKHPHVKSYRLGVYGEGGDGVTIVEIK